MRIKLKNGYMTPLDRKAVKYMLESGMDSCHSSRKNFYLINEGWRYLLKSAPINAIPVKFANGRYDINYEYVYFTVE